MTISSPDGQRIEPALPAHAYQSYALVSPISTHFRPGTCEEAGCEPHRHGWRTVVDEATELGQRQAHYIRRESRRRFREERDTAGLTVFTFEAGQACFTAANGSYDPKVAQHKVRVDREEFYFRRPGDWRGNPTGERPYRHTRADFWAEDFAEHQQQLADRLGQG